MDVGDDPVLEDNYSLADEIRYGTCTHCLCNNSWLPNLTDQHLRQCLTVPVSPTNKLLAKDRMTMLMYTYLLVNLKVMLGNYEFL